MKAKAVWLWILPLALLVATGCAKKADTQKPIEEVKAEAETMSVSELESTAKAYAEEITKKQTDVENIKDQLTGLSPNELLGEKASQIKDQISRIASELSALTVRYQVYADQFKKLGGDFSKIQVS